jgi:hypothetical protein
MIIGIIAFLLIWGVYDCIKIAKRRKADKKWAGESNKRHDAFIASQPKYKPLKK